MNKDSINEMEQIQKGLESFLQQEVEGYGKKQGTDDGIEKDDIDVIGSCETDYEEPHPEKNISGENPVTLQEKNAGALRRTKRVKKEYPDSPVHERRAAKEREENIHNKKGNFKEGASVHVKTGKTSVSEEKHSTRKNKKNVSRKEPPASASSGGKKKKSKWKRVLAFLVLLTVLLGAGWYMLVGAVYAKMKYEPLTALAGSPMKEEGVINILLIGNDSRSQGEDGRSDAMILLSVSSRTKAIYMTSLLRDIYVDIPGYKGNRLNAAYAYGGPELLMETIEQNFDISVNRYVLVNFQAFAKLVDAVGGVDLELTSEEVRYINGYLVEYNILEGRAEGTDYLDESLSGVIHLNGPQALAYSRNRYLGTDFGRTERQRKVLSAVMKQFPAALVTNPKGLVEGLLPNLTTNLTQWECFRLSLQAGKLITYDIVQSSIPIEGSFSNSNIRGMSVLEIDFDKNKKYIRKNIYGSEQ